MRLPRTVPVDENPNDRAEPKLLEMTLRSPGFGPPMTLPAEPLAIVTPVPLPSATVPEGSVPMREPSSVSAPVEVTSIAAPHWLIASALMVVGVPRMARQVEAKPPSRWISICGVPPNPGCVVPSIVIPSRKEIAGRSVASAIECGPVPAMLNAITCGPGKAALASMTAWRRDPIPESAVVVTV